MLCAARPALAQAGTGALTGVVTDAATGQPLAGVVVVATGPAAPDPRSSVTDAQGGFTIGGLPAGRYGLSATLEGYLPETRADLALRASATLRANLVLTPEAVTMEEVVVTGSHIRRKDLNTPAPVTIVSRQELETSGKLQVADYLQALPVQANSMNANYNNGGDGSIRASLRGLGANRTLVLVNGRRYVAGGSGADDAVDLGSIPSAAVERIEILKDGASPIYGSEAIGGVINVITRRAWQGTEVTASAGSTTHGDGTSYAVSLTTGQAGDSGSLMLNAAYGAQQPIWAGHRDWSEFVWAYDCTGASSPRRQVGPYAVGSGSTPAGRAHVVDGPGTTVPNPTGDPRVDLYNQLVTDNPDDLYFTPDASVPGGWRAWAGGALPMYGGDQYNYQPENYLVTPSQRLSLFATGDVKLGSLSRGFVELTYVDRRSQQKIAPAPVVIGADEVVIAADNLYNPFHLEITQGNGRLIGLSNRANAQDVSSLRALGGLGGVFPAAAGPLEDWTWELSGNYGSSVTTASINSFARKSALKAALGPSTNYGSDASPDWGCGTPDHRVEGCVPINLFGGGALTSQQAAPLSYDGTARGTNQLVSFLATSSGELFPLPSGRMVGAAIGYEYRIVSGSSVPDPLQALGETSSTDAVTTTRGSQDVQEAFLEVSLPLLEGRWLAKVVEVQLAGRVFKYGGLEADWTYKVGARWKPFDALTIRGTASTAFRAPTIWELHYGAATSRFQVGDPCAGKDDTGKPVPISPWCGAAANNGHVDPFVDYRNQGNPALKPELAKVFTVGVVLEPPFLPGLSVAVDAYGTSIDQVIQGSGLYPIDTCYPMQADVAPRYCELVRRDPATQALSAYFDSPVNAGSEQMLAYDVAVRYAVPTSLGRFTLAFDSTWLERYDITFGDGSKLRVRGNMDYPRGLGWASPTLRFNSGASWRLGGLSAALDVRYLGSLKECAPDSGQMGAASCTNSHAFEHRISESAVWNAQAGYALTTPAGQTELVVGAQNLLDTQPPRSYGAFYAADPAYDFTGRLLYLRVTHRL